MNPCRGDAQKRPGTVQELKRLTGVERHTTAKYNGYAGPVVLYDASLTRRGRK
jgi:hypothetical protein